MEKSRARIQMNYNVEKIEWHHTNNFEYKQQQQKAHLNRLPFNCISLLLNGEYCKKIFRNIENAKQK